MGTILTFRDYIREMFRGREDLLEIRDKSLYRAVMVNNLHVWHESASAKRVNSYEGAFRFFWNDARFRFISPRFWPCFSTVVRGKTPVKDRDGNILLFVRDKLTDERSVDVDELPEQARKEVGI